MRLLLLKLANLKLNFIRLRVGFFILLLVYFSCSKENLNQGLDIFKYNESSGISSLDPAFSKNQSIIWATSQIFNGLVKLDINLEVQPSIAKHWEISSDGRIYKFFLRNDVFFHDHKLFHNNKGRKVVAQDFVYSFDRLISKQLASPGSWVFKNVKTYSALNDSVLVIKLRNSFTPFLDLLSMQYCSVVPKEIAERSDFRSNPIGTGPFKFQYWKEGVKLVLRRNPNYFEKDENGASLPYLDAVSITFIKDKQSVFLKFLQGDIDLISGIDNSYKDEILNKKGRLKDKYSKKMNLQTSPYLNTEYLAFLMDSDHEISTNIKVRKAINYGFDRRKMLKYLRNSIGDPAEQGFIPRGLPSFSEDMIGYTYNPEKAKLLLEEAGFPNGQGLDKIILSTTSSYTDFCKFISSQLAEIGLDVEIREYPDYMLREMKANARLDFFRASWIADYPDAENYMALFYSKNFSPGGPNYTHFNNKEFDLLYEESIQIQNLKRRRELYRKMDQMIIDHAIIVPLYYDEVFRIFQKNILGLDGNTQNLLDLLRVRKK